MLSKMLIQAAVGAGVGGWNISNAVYDTSFSVNSQESTPRAMYFSSDGTRLFVVGTSGDDVNQYSLSTAWDISSASYIRVRSLSSILLNPTGVSFSSDGTKMIIIGSYNQGGIFQGFIFPHIFTLSTPWNISTTNYIDYSAIVMNYFFIREDGLVSYSVSSSTVTQYSMSVAWDITTMTSVDSFSVSSEDSSPAGIHLSPDGTRMYLVGTTGDEINQYQLSTAWSITSASYVRTLSVNSIDNAPYAVSFKPDGKKMFLLGDQNNSIYSYNL
jgi:6-phosphogluconolactonase (cycloisomerase 2 family)